ncbi:septum formation protein Maf [Candidatus Peregrinibacteria bacterium]|nr:septum formation protein Maf [Candidatus Peregrinibacteria bacterium]
MATECSQWILASKSPQRKAILKKWGIPFKAISSGVSETWGSRKIPSAIVREIAKRKAESVASHYPNHWVIGVDTLVFFDKNRQIGKPKDREEAKKIIQNFSGKYCDVYSGVALINKCKKRRIFEAEKTRLFFRKISRKTCEAYLKTGEWKGRSGAMTLEGAGSVFVRRIQGDYWNVIGFPAFFLEFIKKMVCNS